MKDVERCLSADGAGSFVFGDCRVVFFVCPVVVFEYDFEDCFVVFGLEYCGLPGF